MTVSISSRSDFSASSKMKWRFVDEDNQLWFLEVAHFRQRGVEFRQHLEHEGGEKFRAILHIAQTQNRDRAEAVDDPQQAGHFKGRLPEKFLRALLFELDQLAQNEREMSPWRFIVGNGRAQALRRRLSRRASRRRAKPRRS